MGSTVISTSLSSSRRLRMIRVPSLVPALSAHEAGYSNVLARVFWWVIPTRPDAGARPQAALSMSTTGATGRSTQTPTCGAWPAPCR
jgi:hypothetical protein